MTQNVDLTRLYNATRVVLELFQKINLPPYKQAAMQELREAVAELASPLSHNQGINDGQK